MCSLRNVLFIVAFRQNREKREGKSIRKEMNVNYEKKFACEDQWFGYSVGMG